MAAKRTARSTKPAAWVISGDIDFASVGALWERVAGESLPDTIELSTVGTIDLAGLQFLDMIRTHGGHPGRAILGDGVERFSAMAAFVGWDGWHGAR